MTMIMTKTVMMMVMMVVVTIAVGEVDKADEGVLNGWHITRLFTMQRPNPIPRGGLGTYSPG